MNQAYEKINWSPFRNEIKCFETCVEFKTMTVAAERVGLTQASLSKIIQKLEHELQTQLFIRNSRGIQLTHAGKQFLSSVKSIQTTWNTLKKLNQTDENSSISELKIGAHTSIANTVLPKIMPQLIFNYPAIEFSFEFKRSIEITQKVVNAEIDLGFVINPVKNNYLVAKKLSSEFISLWGNQGANSFSETVLYSTDMFLSDKLLKMLKQKKLIEVNDYEVISNLLKTTQFSGLLPSTVAERFNFTQLQGKLYSVDLSLIYRKDRFVNKAQRQLINQILQSI